jgi:cytochrome c peroxidase
VRPDVIPVIRHRAAWLTLVALAAATLAGAVGQPLGEEPITPLDPPETLDPGKVELGRLLFHEVRLSHGDVVACSTCHRLDLGGDDGQSRSIAADGRPLDFNTTTVFNAARNFRLNWRGNYRTLEEQNEAVLLDPRLMNTTWEEVLPKLSADPGYRGIFAAVYGTGPDRASVLDALAVYQRSLVTTDGRFDRYLRGERGAITPDEERGYELFKAYGCIACHQGTNIGGNLFQKFGIFYDPFAQRARKSEADLGRFAVTGKEADRYVFRVPSLRNVTATAPYFHDGSTATLTEAVEIMARSQLGRELPIADRDAIVAFLGTLAGQYQGRTVRADADRSAR